MAPAAYIRTRLSQVAWIALPTAAGAAYFYAYAWFTNFPRQQSRPRRSPGTRCPVRRIRLA